VKEVTVNVYDESNANALVETFAANDDGSFSVELAPGTYTVEAKADGFLSAETSAVAITEGNTTDVGSATLHAGDITDEFGTGGDNVVDEWDTMTIGMNYNGTVPAAADLNNDGVINLLDLELLAANYRDTGPTAWE